MARESTYATVAVLAAGDYLRMVDDPGGTPLTRNAVVGTYTLGDDVELLLGAGSDAAIDFDGTDLIVNFDKQNAGTTDLRIREAGTDRLVVETGATLLTLAAAGATFAGKVTLGGDLDMGAFGNRIDLDIDNDTSLRATADDIVALEVGGVDAFTWTGSALGFYYAQLAGAFTSDGNDTVVAGLAVKPALTGASGDTSWQALLAAGIGVGGSITTQAVAETIGQVATVYLSEPNLTLGAASGVTLASTLYIQNAPSEAVDNYALYVAAGESLFVEGVEIRAAAGAAGTLTLATAETTVVDGDVLGQIDFQAPLEASGSDAIVVGASIWGEADDTFAGDNNTTDLVFGTAESGAVTAKVWIKADGKVGIGTNGPAHAVEISGSASPRLRVTDSTTPCSIDIYAVDTQGQIGTATNHDMLFRTNALVRMAMLAGGDIGIGTETPSYPLEIAGASHATAPQLVVGTDTDATVGIGALDANYGWIQSFGSVPLHINPQGNAIVFGGYVVLDITDTDATVEGSIWYDASEDKLKFKTAAGVETITSA